MKIKTRTFNKIFPKTKRNPLFVRIEIEKKKTGCIAYYIKPTILARIINFSPYQYISLSRA